VHSSSANYGSQSLISSGPGVSTFLIVLIILVGVAIIAGAGIGLFIYLRRNQNKPLFLN